MASRRGVGRAVLCLAAALANGCAHSPAPPGWLPKSAASVSDASGGWFVTELGRGPGGGRIEGELIAVAADSIFVLRGDGLAVLAKAAIKKATVAGYDIEARKIALWTVLGTLSTASHGVGLLLTAPLWIIAGSISTGSASRAPLIHYPARPWTEVAAYARFPQGLPAGLDRARLRRK